MCFLFYFVFLLARVRAAATQSPKVQAALFLSCYRRPHSPRKTKNCCFVLFLVMLSNPSAFYLFVSFLFLYCRRYLYNASKPRKRKIELQATSLFFLRVLSCCFAAAAAKCFNGTLTYTYTEHRLEGHSTTSCPLVFANLVNTKH